MIFIVVAGMGVVGSCQNGNAAIVYDKGRRVAEQKGGGGVIYRSPLLKVGQM